MVVKDCPECHGTGKVKVGEKECPVCEGWGGYVPADFKIGDKLKGYRNLDHLGVEDEVDEIPCLSAMGRVLFQFTTPARPAGELGKF